MDGDKSFTHKRYARYSTSTSMNINTNKKKPTHDMCSGKNVTHDCHRASTTVMLQWDQQKLQQNPELHFKVSYK